MAWIDPLVELRDVLADLYVAKDDAVVVVEEASLPPEQIKFDDKAVTNWHNILREAHRRGKVCAIVDVARRQYGDYAALENASQSYAAAIASGALTTPGASETIYGWHCKGAWILGIAGFWIVALIGLSALYLHGYPAIAAALSVIGAALSYLFDWFGIRKEKAVLQRLSHRFGETPILQAAAVIIVLVSVGLWLGSAPRIAKIVWGPDLCGRATVSCLMVSTVDIGNDEDGSSQQTAGTYAWTPAALRTVEQKLGVVPGLKIFATPRDLGASAGLQTIDYRVTPWYEQMDSPVIGFSIFDAQHKHLLPDPNVAGYNTASPADVQEHRNQLTYMLLERMGIETPDEVKRAILGTPTESIKAMQLNNEGVELLQNGRVDEAEALFREALAIDPGYSIALANLGYVQYYYRGHLAEAITLYESAVELLDSYAVHHFNLGRLYLVDGREEAAIAELTKATERRHGYVEAYNELGKIYLGRKQWSKARLTLEEGISWDASCASLHMNLGNLHVQKGDADEAIRVLKVALALEAEQRLGIELAGQWEVAELQDIATALHALDTGNVQPPDLSTNGPACGLGWRGLAEMLWLLAEAHARTGENASTCELLGYFGMVDEDRVTPWVTDAERLFDKQPCE